MEFAVNVRYQHVHVVKISQKHLLIRHAFLVQVHPQKKNKQLHKKIDKSGPMFLSPCEAFICQLAVYTRMSILRWPSCISVSVHVTNLVLTCLLWAGYDEKGCRA